jgi:perosamine synthetase
MKTFVSVRPSIDDDDIAAVTRTLRSGHLEEGEDVRDFERAVSAYLGKANGQATVNGFSAIHVLLHALGIGAGDEIILPSYCCPAVLFPIKLLGAKPVFADIGVNSFNMTAETASKVRSSRTRAVLLAYHFGFPNDIAAIVELFGREKVIEDVAQAIGAFSGDQLVGSFSAHSVASFYASKMVTCGDGGMALTNDPIVAARMRELVYYGSRRGHQEMGFNYHLTNMNAALGLSQLRKLNAFVAKRRRLAKIYREVLQCEECIHFDFAYASESVFLRFPVLLPTKQIRDSLKQKLAECHVHCGYGVLEALHEKEGLDGGNLPNTHRFLSRILCLPIYPDMEVEDARWIAEQVLQHIRNLPNSGGEHISEHTKSAWQ